ncbi:MAG: PHB depolymerase family esterase, partial [bacterium]
MKPMHFGSGVALILTLVPALASAQALTNITSLFVTYSSRKVTTNPSGELKARLDSLDAELSAANRRGQTGELRRLLAKGNVLLSGKPWTEVADFNASLLLRTDRVVVESQRPYTVRVEQLYAPAIELPRSLTAHAALVSRPTGAGASASPSVVKDFGTRDGVSRDLRESPLALELDLHDVPDGRYAILVDIADSARTLGSATLGVVVRKGIDDMATRLEDDAKRTPVGLRAEVLYPVDRMRNVNRGRLELRTLDVDKDFATAESVVVALRVNKDPFLGRTGEFKRHYTLEAANEVMPYHLLVPSSYTTTHALPLIIALHGLGATEDSFFDAYGKKLPALAEQRGYIVAAPLGYRVDGGYGWGVGNAPLDATTRRSSELSEADVMQVLAEVRKNYNIDPNRIYLMGHSLGAIGTWKLAPKYPTQWAALGAFSGQGAPATIARFRDIPEFVVHGDADPTVNVAGSRAMVAAMKTLNVDVKYIEVPGGNHGNVVEPNLAGMFDFFD